MTYISLFAGIGGFDLALSRHGHECVWANEWDKYASFLYARNLGEIDTRDITTIPTSEIPDHDLLVGGFPCQAFSIAGKRRGFAETRGTLFFEIARILKDKQPKYFILENVKGLLSHDEGRTFRTIITTLTDLGYDLQWQVLNSKNFGVPQNRERVFIVGNLRGEPRPQIFPVSGEVQEATQSRDMAGTLQADYWKRDRTGGYVIEAERYKALTEARTEEAKAIRRKMREQGKDWSPRRGKETKLREDGMMNTLTANKSVDQLISDEAVVRLLTPTECERLQGFPDGWTEGVSDTQRYKCLGNAVTVNVVEYIVSRLNTSQPQTLSTESQPDVKSPVETN